MRLTMGESGGRNIAQQIQDVNSTNGSGGAKGVTQMLQSTFDAFAVPRHHNIWNTADNEAASVRYQLAHYGRLVGHPGYSRGGRLPFVQMGDGGTFSTAVPTMMMVGERGQRETVHVSRESAGGGRRSNGSISISIGHITYRGEGDVQKVVERELRKAIAAIGAAPIDGESELD